MERAIAITAQGHVAVARATVAGVSERDVQTQLEYGFFASGGTGLSYSSIVGSGPIGAVLHWDKNTRLLQDGDGVVGLDVHDAGSARRAGGDSSTGAGMAITDIPLVVDREYLKQ